MHFNSVQLSRTLEDNSDIIVTKYGIQDQGLIPDKGEGLAFVIVRAGATLRFRPVSYPVFVIRAVSADKRNFHPVLR
jgi:hypothetical protein